MLNTLESLFTLARERKKTPVEGSYTNKLLNDKSISFDGIDGKFSFEKNIISRKLNVLKISNGKANLIKWTY